MIEDYNDYDDSSWNKKKSKKLKQNPNGPYTIEDFVFKGVIWNIVIQNVSHDDFQVTAISNKKVKHDTLNVLKKYLKTEGFEEAARKHNLFW